MRTIKSAFTILFLIYVQMCYSQKEHTIWYFGDAVGLEFRGNIVRPLNDGKMNALEGCSVISDPTGKLLFYTNGKEVYNAQHQIMPNGLELAGSVSSAQSSIIIPHPGN